MTTYLLRFDHLDGDTRIRPLTIDATTPAELAQAVHRHARGRLGSGRVNVHFDPDTLTGQIVSHGVAVGAFTLEVAEEPAAATAPEGIRGGWTLTTLDRLARAVVSNNFTWWSAGDREDLYTAAWHGIVEHLYSADTVPTRNALMEAGRQAIASDVKATMRHHGTRRDSSNTGQKHAMYWEWAGRAVPSPEAGIVERLALAQILTALTPGQRAALDALAAAGDYEQAARLIGATSTGLKSQLMKGRRRFRELWHEGETPSAHWGVDRRAGTTAGTVGEGTALGRIRRRARTARAQTGEAA